jgi:hypothetical protein
MLRSCGQSLMVASLGLAWLALAACADRGTPVSTASPPAADAGGGDVEGLTGRVVSAAGAPVENALVTPRSLDGGAVPEMAVLTDENGRYTWTLRPGRYQVSVSAEGFDTATAKATIVEHALTTLDFTLAPAR